MSITQTDNNVDPDLFPDPMQFRPERWLEKDEKKRLSKYLHNFGRGRRICLGMELALSEVYLAVGRLFSPNTGLTLTLFDTAREQDVDQFHDYFSPFPRTTKGIRATVS